MTSGRKLRVAVTQAEPAWLNLQAAVQKTCLLIEEAKRGGAQLITFPECWIPGYPAWIWSRNVDFNLTSKYIKNSLRNDSPEMATIQACAKEHSIMVAIGYSENSRNSLFISQCVINEDGKIIMHRRKVKATHMERTIFGDGSGESLNNVVQTPLGQLGSLACWEHTQPLLKYHTILQGEEMHVSAWPPVYSDRGGPELWSMSKEGCRNLSQTYAIESQTFVFHTTAVISQPSIESMNTSLGITLNVPGGGSSAIFGPDGRQLSVDIPETEEGIVYANLDLDEILKAKGFLDICGHYSRPDLLWLGVDAREKRHHYQHGDPVHGEGKTEKIYSRDIKSNGRAKDGILGVLSNGFH